MSKIQVVFVGDKGVGKTSFIKKIETNLHNPEYIPTKDIYKCTVNFQSNYGNFIFKIVEVSNLEYVYADVVILCIDLSRSDFTKYVNKWNSLIKDQFDSKTPVFYCGMKSDINKNIISKLHFVCSSKNTCKSELKELFRLIAKKLTSSPGLVFF